MWCACLAGVDDIPSLGVEKWEKVQRREKWQASFRQFLLKLDAARITGEWGFSFEVHQLFLGWAGLSEEECSMIPFGRKLSEAGWEQGRRTREKLSSVEGLSLERLRAML